MNLPTDNKFWISFDTKKDSSLNMIRGTTITIKEDVMGLDDVAHINLCEHPLYKQLHAYCMSNRPR